jgi:putative endonuclease
VAWFTYLVRCADGTLYCGVSTDVSRRVEEHNTSPRGARYTRSRRPVALVWRRRFRTRSAACREEARVKRLDREDKLALVTS